MGAYSFVKSVRRSQSDVYVCHIRISGCVCYNSAQISLIKTPSERKPVTHFVGCVQRLQYLNHLFRNLCQRYEVRLWHVPFNQFHTVWINYAPCLRDFMQTKIVCDQKAAMLGENRTCFMSYSLVYTSRAFLKTNTIVWIPFLRAMVLTRDPEAKSLWFETRSGKNSAASQLLGLSARKFRRWSFTCVNKAANWAPFVMSSVFSTPFFNSSIVGQL